MDQTFGKLIAGGSNADANRVTSLSKIYAKLPSVLKHLPRKKRLRQIAAALASGAEGAARA
jgi:hypothetical protein